MNCVINSKRLQNMLGFLVANDKEAKKVATNRVLISVGDGYIKFTSVYSNIYKTSTCTCDIRGSKELCVEFSKLKKAIDSFKSDIDIHISNQYIKLSAGNVEFIIDSLENEDFNKPPIIKYSDNTVKLEEIQEAFKQVRTYTGSDIKYLLNHVLLATNELVATNGIVLIKKEIKLGVSGLLNGSICNDIVKLPVNPVFIGENSDTIGFKSGWAEIIAYKAKGNFPNYNAAIPTTYTSYLKCDTSKVRDAIKMYPYEGKNTTSNTVILNAEGNKITILKEELAKIVFSYVIDGETKGLIRAGIDYKVFKMVIDSVISKTLTLKAESLETGFTIKPLLIKDKNAIIVFMPIRMD